MKNRTEQIDPYGTVHIETSGVNNEALTEELITYTIETLTNTFFHDMTEEHDRDIIIRYHEHFFEVMSDAGYIEQFDIIFDKRNNTKKEMSRGAFAIELKYKQKNCLNYTRVKFLIGGKK